MTAATNRGNGAARLPAMLFVLITLPLALASAPAADDVPPELFFTVPPSAAALGRGTVSTSGAMDASDIYRLTANSALADGSQFISGLTERRDGMRAVYGAAALPVFYTGAIGFFSRSVIPLDDYPALNSFGVSLAKYYTEYNYGIGGHVAFLESGWDKKKENFASFGLNLRFDPEEAFSGHIYLIGSGFPLRANSSMFRERLADQYGASASYYPLRGVSDFWGLDLGVGAQATGGGPLVLGASAELSVDSRLFLRMGYENPVDRRPDVSASGLSMGAGFLVGGLGLDAAYRFGAKVEGGGVWAVSAKLHIERLKRRAAEDNLALAQKYFDRRDYDRTLLYARRALAADPINWGAQALQNKASAEIRRVESANKKAAREFAIIYGGNARGQAIPYPPSPDALGGLSRYAAVVSSLRRDWPVNFSVDAGNILSAKNNELRVELAAAYYDIMGFDAIAPGEGEMAAGAFRFMAAQKRALPVVISNMGDNNAQQTGIWSSLLLTNSGVNVYLVNMISRSAAADSGKALTDFSYYIGELRTLLNGPRAANADMRVAVIHGTMEEIRQVAGALPEIDVVIAGSLNERFNSPLKIGRTLVLSAGSGHKFAGRLSVKPNEKRRRTTDKFTFEHRLYPVYQTIAPDSAVEDAVRLVDAAITVEETRGGVNVLARVRGVFPYLSDRGDGPRAFIKALENKSEHPLADGNMLYCRNPVFSTAGNRAAFIYGRPEEMNGKLRIVDLSARNGVNVSSNGNVLEAAFSPTNDFLYYIEADSGRLNGTIYKTKMYMFDAIAILDKDDSLRRDLSVSDDGATLLFCAKAGDGGRWQVFAIDTSAAAAPAQLTGDDADHRYPRMCPDGKRVAYLSNRGTFGGQMNLWVFERGRAGGAHRQLTFNTNVRNFCWGGNSETIFISSGANVFEISGVEVEGGEVRRLIPPPRPADSTKSWSENTPRMLMYENSLRVLYTREYIDGKRRLYWYDLRRRADEKVYAIGENDEWLD